MSFLKITNLRKSYGSLEILKDINLEIEEGGFLVLVGPSGCGKSTLLRMIAGLESVTSGEIRIAGKRVNELAPKDRDIAMVFQSYALYPHLTVKDNMGLGLKQAGAPKAEIDNKVGKAASMLSLDPYLARRPAELSGGQRQRVAIGRAIVREPKLFLFDEPLSNLDAALRVNTRLEIARLHRSLKATMIYVTHDQVEAMTLADKIVVLNAGKIEQIGSPMDLYNRPANVFVAGFIGSPQMNFIEGARLGDAGAKTIGIRPEHMALSRESGDWKGKVIHVEHLGADTIVYIDSEQAGTITVRLFGEHRYAPDDIVYATPMVGSMHRFGDDDRVLA